MNSGFATLFEREIKRFMKVVVQTIVTPFVSSFLYLLVFGVSLGSQVKVHGDVPYLAFLVPGLMMMGLMNNAFQNSSSSIVSSKFSGDLEDIRVAPITNQQIVWAMSLGGVVRGALVAVITYLVGALFYYFQQGEVLLIQHPLILLYFIVMGGLIFGMIGIGVAFWANTFDQLSAFSAFVLLPLTYLGGVFISIESLHPFWQVVAKLNPLLYLINGLRYGVLGVSDVDISLSVVLSLIGFAGFYGVSLWSLRKGSFQRW
ncbi:ABC transporter permease [Bdellovibrio sp. HCB337]|uniref:ABC transporter permease n=1 Tax=Bdellovibrio sp. HCB337 TaxID=3394358 RepID=UPI0039A552F7